MPPKKGAKAAGKPKAVDPSAVDDFDALCKELTQIDTTGRAPPPVDLATQRKEALREARKKMAANDAAGSSGGQSSTPQEPPKRPEWTVAELEAALVDCNETAPFRPALELLLAAKSQWTASKAFFSQSDDYDRRAFLEAIHAGFEYHLPSAAAIEHFKMAAKALRQEPMLVEEEVPLAATQKLLAVCNFLLFEDEEFGRRHADAEVPKPRFNNNGAAAALMYEGSLGDALFVQSALLLKIRGPAKAAAAIPAEDASSDQALASAKAFFLRALGDDDGCRALLDAGVIGNPKASAYNVAKAHWAKSKSFFITSSAVNSNPSAGPQSQPKPESSGGASSDAEGSPSESFSFKPVDPIPGIGDAASLLKARSSMQQFLDAVPAVPAAWRYVADAHFTMACVWGALGQAQEQASGAAGVAASSTPEWASEAIRHYNEGVRAAHQLPGFYQATGGAMTGTAKKASQYAAAASRIIYGC